VSYNSQTYLKYIYTAITANAAYEQLSETNKYVYALVIGVNADSASATTGNWVGTSSAVTTTNKDGVKITADKPFSVGAYSVGNMMIPVNLKDYFVATTSGDEIYVAYLEETQQT